MSDELLPFYERELAFIRSMGAEFAERHPKIAARLRLRPEGSQDPHAERMIEAFAYLNARIRHKLEDDFPELTEALLNTLYPHYLAPVPSMAIVQLGLDPSQAELAGGYEIGTGSVLETDTIDGEPCRFQTSYPVTLWPLNVTTAELQHPPFRSPALPRSADTQSMLHLTLETFGAKLPLAELVGCDVLRFYLHGQSSHVHALYELLFNNALGLAVARTDRDEAPHWMDAACIRAVGFEIEEGLLPYTAQSFLGYRLLTEYFCFPEKFLFVDLDLKQISPAFRESLGTRMELYVPFDAERPDLERNVSVDTFRLGCTPMVNLFRQRAESIPMKGNSTEYRVVPDSRRPLAMEIYSIDAVKATSPAQDEVEYRPFHSFQHAAAGRDQQAFWQASRRRGTSFGTTPDHGTEIYLQLVDLQGNAQSSNDWILDVETTCLNRDLPHRLPFGGDEPRLHLEKGGPVTQIHCLTQPTATRRAPLRHGTLWRLLSHLSLNHISLCDSEQGADALREILTLYDYVASDVSRASIDGVQNISYRPAVGRVDQGLAGGLCRGVEITVDFDEDRYTGGGVFLLMCVLDRFLGLSCSVNSFTRFVATTNHRERPIKKWPPRSGTRVLL